MTSPSMKRFSPGVSRSRVRQQMRQGQTSRPAPVCITSVGHPSAPRARKQNLFPPDLIGQVASVKVSTGSSAASDECASPFTALSVSIASRA
jgi:hypothetical protein